MICHGRQSEREQVESWWREYRRTGSRQCRDSLAEHYLPLVQREAGRLRPRLADHVVVEDLVSAGNLGLLAALEGFDPDRGAKFETYAGHHIRGAMLDDLRRNDKLSRLTRVRVRRLRQVVEEYQTRYGRRPDERELAKGLKIPASAVRELEAVSRASHMVPLAVNKFGDREDAAAALPADEWVEQPDWAAARAELRELLERHLGQTDRLVLTMYYFEEMTQKEIAGTLGISESRVCQIQADALASIRARVSRRPTMRLSA